MEIGVLKFIYDLIKDLSGWVFRKFKPMEPSEVIAIRQRWKNEFEENLGRLRNESELDYGPVIIRDVRRFDCYPEVDEKATKPSPWYRVGLLQTYHKGIEVGIEFGYLMLGQDAGEWRKADVSEQGKVKVLLVGRIPYERIKSVDWRGDGYYNCPHIYCDFSDKHKGPYEELVYCEVGIVYERMTYREVTNLDSVEKFTREYARHKRKS